MRPGKKPLPSTPFELLKTAHSQPAHLPFLTGNGTNRQAFVGEFTLQQKISKKDLAARTEHLYTIRAYSSCRFGGRRVESLLFTVADHPRHSRLAGSFLAVTQHLRQKRPDHDRCRVDAVRDPTAIPTKLRRN